MRTEATRAETRNRILFLPYFRKLPEGNLLQNIRNIKDFFHHFLKKASTQWWNVKRIVQKPEA